MHNHRVVSSIVALALVTVGCSEGSGTEIDEVDVNGTYTGTATAKRAGQTVSGKLLGAMLCPVFVRGRRAERWLT